MRHCGRVDDPCLRPPTSPSETVAIRIGDAEQQNSPMRTNASKGRAGRTKRAEAHPRLMPNSAACSRAVPAPGPCLASPSAPDQPKCARVSPCSSACMQAAVGLGTRQCAVGKVQESGQMEALVFPDLKIAAILGGRVCGIWLERQAGCRCNGHPFRRAAGAQGWPMRRLLTLGSAVVTVARRAARHEDAVAPRGFTNWCGTVPFWARCSGTAMVLSSRAAPCATQFGAGIQTDTRHPAMPYGACLGTPRRRTRIGRACCASAQPMRWTAAAHGARRE